MAIIRVLEELERKDIELDFVGKNWDIWLKFKPEEAINVSIADQLAELEAKFKSHGQTLPKMKVQSLNMNDQLKLVRNDYDVHVQYLQQILSNVILKMNDSDIPTAAEVLVASTSQTDTPALVLPGHAQTLDNAQHVQGTINKNIGLNKSAAPRQLKASCNKGITSFSTISISSILIMWPHTMCSHV